MDESAQEEFCQGVLTESRQRNSWEELHHAADQVEEGGAKGNESSASKVVEEKGTVANAGVLQDGRGQSEVSSTAQISNVINNSVF